MYTSEQISYIMTELGLDPADPASRKVIERLVESKPNVPINDRFIALLREDLQAKAAQVAPNADRTPIHSMVSSFMTKMLASALVVMVVLAAGSLWYIQNRTDQPLFQTPGSEAGQLLSGKYAVTGVAEESFGDLNKVSIVASRDAAGLNNNTTGSSNATSTAPYQGGGQPVADPAPNTSESLKIAPAPPYTYTQYQFKYEGEDLPTLSESQSVLKRVQPKQNSSVVSRIIGMLSFGLVDLDKFQDVQLQSFSFAEDREFGYSLFVDMISGSVSINQNWMKWPQLQMQSKRAATDIACIPEAYNCGGGYQPLSLEDMPINDDVFNATNQFLVDYGISTEAYGEPMVIDSNWRILYEQADATSRTNFYFPEQITVTYPLVIEGKQVLDESGNPNGLTLTYDIRSQKVTNVYELTTKQFEKSDYKGVVDGKHLIDVAEKGGFRNYSYYNDPNAQTKELTLETPSVRLVKLWYSSPDGNSNSGELYVPALVFPIKDWKESGYWRSNVIVPLVKDILDSDQQGQPIPVDLPVQTTNVGGNASSGSAPESTPLDLPKQTN